MTMRTSTASRSWLSSKSHAVELLDWGANPQVGGSSCMVESLDGRDPWRARTGTQVPEAPQRCERCAGGALHNPQTSGVHEQPRKREIEGKKGEEEAGLAIMVQGFPEALGL